MFKHTAVAASVLTLLTGAAWGQNETTDTSASALSTPEYELQAAPVPTASTLIKAAPTTGESRARSYQTWLNQINKPYANQLGSGNGTGVVVGVVDSGVQIDHPELKNQIVARYNAFNGGTDVTDQMGHGTHVSGIIAGSLANGSLLEGVAPGAKIAMAKVFQTGSSTTDVIGRGIDWVVNTQKAPIVSLSLGSGAVSLQSNIQNAVTKGTLVVAALGNNGYNNAASWPAEFAKASWAKNQVIAVGALDANNKRASFSNVDATLANWTVYAPGVNVASSYSDTTTKNAYVYMSGTSMATPIVSGQAALIKSNWNFLTASNLSGIIFQSATRICSDGASASTCATRTTADKVYGWGLVNVAASLQPLGNLTVGTSTGTAVNYSGTSLATAKSGLATGLTGVNTIAVDKFNRGFVVNLSSTALKTTTASTPTSGITSTTAGRSKFAAEYSNQTTAQSALGLVGSDTGNVTVGKMSYAFSSPSGSAMGWGLGGTESQFLGLDTTGHTPLSLNGEGSRFVSPYFAVADNATHGGYSLQWNASTVLRIASVTQTPSYTGALPSAALGQGDKSITAAELQKAFGSTTAVVTVGHLQESDTMLGSYGSGALALGKNTGTDFVTLAATRPVAPQTHVSAMVSFGQTGAGSASANSLIDGVTASRSMAWSLGLSSSDVWRKGDKLGLSVAMPLRTMSGDMQVTTAVSQSQADGSLQYAQQNVALSPGGSERDIELAYTRALKGGASLSAMAQVKLQPGHVADAAPQHGIGVKWMRAF